MDLICPVCGEPWDNDELHDNDNGLSYGEALGLFQSRGCGAVFGCTCKPSPSMRTALASAAYDLLGDDADGAAAMLADAEMMGYL